ncbi:MAG: response regulator [Deltaproteobacteria bacterium]|nr:response regulator [Deltaproteobacteria bacterium]
MNGIDPELVVIFLDEATELLDSLFADLTQLQKKSANTRTELLRSILRKAHNLKGASAPIGVDEIARRCHDMEDLMSPFTESPEEIPNEIFDTVKGHLLALETLIHEIKSPPNRPSAVPVENPIEGRTGGSKQDNTDTGSMRIAISRLDKLWSYSGELLSSRARMSALGEQLQKFVNTFQSTVAANPVLQSTPELSDAMKLLQQDAGSLLQKKRNDMLDFGHLVESINTTLKQLRMVPLKTAEHQWRQIVRDAAQKENKSVELNVISRNVELDKHVLGQLKDPITHMLRNAVSHGIESSQERVIKGKPAIGTITLDANVVGSNVQLYIEDDGKGIDIERVLEIAIGKNLVDLDTDDMSRDDIVDLLFHAGFSTAETVSTVSGRGVGLDVVRQRIQAIGGSVSVVHSEENVGTTFMLSAPLSILSSLGLFVEAGDTTFAIPVDDVARVFRVSAESVVQVNGKPVVKDIHGNLIHLVFLSEFIGLKRTSAPWYNVIILERNTTQLGLIVERIEGQQEFVTSRLPWNMVNVPGVTGAVVRPDGKLAISLDVRYLFAHGHRLMPRQTRGIAAAGAMGVPTSIQNILVVDDSAAARALGKKILQDGGFQVHVAQDGTEAVPLLQQHAFDLVVSDVDMPQMDGLALTRYIRSTPQLKDLPVILITSKDSPKERAQGAEAGADEYVIKGTFDQRFLLDLVSKYI